MKFFSKLTKTGSKPKRNKVQLAVESLEERKLMAGDIRLVNSILTVEGSNYDDVAHVRMVTRSFGYQTYRQVIAEVEHEGHVHTKAFNLDLFGAQPINSIYFYGFNGDDSFVNYTDIAARAYGHDGDDTLIGGSGNDSLYGGRHNDRLAGREGDDYLSGDYGRDIMYGDWGRDRMYGGGDNDTMYGYTGDDTMYGGSGADRLYGSNDNDYLYGDSGNDSLYGGSGRDRLQGSYDNDYLSGGDQNDTLYGSYGNDTLYGGNHEDELYGQNDNDKLYGDSGHDKLDGGSGHDRLQGSYGDDELRGGSGNDTLYGSYGWDTLYGDSGNDHLYGNDDNDNLYGGANDDYLDGGIHNDGLIGGDGRDTVIGGAGADRFVSWKNHDGWLGKEDPDDIRDRDWFDDALITFEGSPAVENKKFTGLEGEYDFDEGKWTESEIEKIDVALANLHHHVGNTRLLKKADGGEVSFVRLGAQTTFPSEPSQGGGSFTIGGFNGNGRVTMVNTSFSSDNNLWRIVYHEMGHNWDETSENSHIDNFRALSGWVESDNRPTAAHVASRGSGDRWWHINNPSNFARTYGQQNPLEDYATTWETYFMNQYHGTTMGNTIVTAKFNNLDDLFDDLRNS